MMKKKTIIIVLSVLTLICTPLIYLLFANINLNYNPSSYPYLRKVLVNKEKNVFAGILDVVQTAEKEDSVEFYSLFDFNNRFVVEKNKDNKVKIEKDFEEAGNKGQIYVEIGYQIPKLTLKDKVFCSVPILKDKCTKYLELKYINIESIHLKDITKDLKEIIVKQLSKVVVDNDLDNMQGKYSPSLDAELSSYIYKQENNILTSEDQKEVIKLIEEENAFLKRSYAYTPLISNTEVIEKIKNNLCDDYNLSFSNEGEFKSREGINMLLANKYCNASYEDIQIVESFTDLSYELEDSYSHAETVKILGLCSMISDIDDLSSLCKEKFLNYLVIDSFCYPFTDKISKSPFCSKEYIYTVYLTLLKEF